MDHYIMILGWIWGKWFDGFGEI